MEARQRTRSCLEVGRRVGGKTHRRARQHDSFGGDTTVLEARRRGEYVSSVIGCAVRGVEWMQAEAGAVMLCCGPAWFLAAATAVDSTGHFMLLSTKDVRESWGCASSDSRYRCPAGKTIVWGTTTHTSVRRWPATGDGGVSVSVACERVSWACTQCAFLRGALQHGRRQDSRRTRGGLEGKVGRGQVGIGFWRRGPSRDDCSARAAEQHR